MAGSGTPAARGGDGTVLRIFIGGFRAMKYVIFFAGLLLVVPAGALLAAYSRRIRDLVFVTLVISTAFISTGGLDINFVERWWYRGTTHGIEISFVDLFTLMLLASIVLSMRRERVRLYWPASLGLMLVYLGYGCLNVAVSDPRLFGVLELSKMLRGLLAFLAVAWYVQSEREARLLLVTVSLLFLYEGGLVIWQRYGAGTMRVTGSFNGPPVLANYCCLLAPVVLAVSFSKARLAMRALCGTAWALACVATILSITRMGFAAMIAASAGVLLVSSAKDPSPRKATLALLSCVLASGLFLRGYDVVAERHRGMSASEKAGNASAGRRGYYVDAWMMATRNPLGVGLNNWSYWLSAERGDPYESTEVRGEGPREVMAHSAFALTLGELGWPGIVIFGVLWCQWLWIAGRSAFARDSDLLSVVLIGCFFSVLAACLSAATEHNFRSQLFYIVFNMVLGFMVAVRRLHASAHSTRPTS